MSGILCPFKDNYKFARCCPDDYYYTPTGSLMHVLHVQDYYRTRCNCLDCPGLNNEPVFEFPNFDTVDTSGQHWENGSGVYIDWLTGTGKFK